MVCAEVLRPSQPMGSCRARTVYLTILLLGRPKRLTSIVHILSPENDKWRKEENDRRKYFMINIHKRMLPTRRGSNPQPPGTSNSL